MEVDVVYVADTRTIRIIPEQDLLPSRTYRVELTDRLMSAAGERYAGAEWSFATAGPIGDTRQSTLDRCVSDPERSLLEAINLARQTGRYCGGDWYPPVKPVTYQCALDSVARKHAEALADQQWLSHYSSDGSSPAGRVRQSGYDTTRLLENLARTETVALSPVMDQWLSDPTACEGLMDPEVTHLGLGRAESETAGVYWVQNLVRPDGRSAQLD